MGDDVQAVGEKLRLVAGVEIYQQGLALNACAEAIFQAFMALGVEDFSFTCSLSDDDLAAFHFNRFGQCCAGEARVNAGAERVEDDVTCGRDRGPVFVTAGIHHLPCGAGLPQIAGAGLAGACKL